jgi:hypothetical protein
MGVGIHQHPDKTMNTWGIIYGEYHSLVKTLDYLYFGGGMGEIIILFYLFFYLFFIFIFITSFT